MKILFVITKSDIGGAQVFVLNLATVLKKMGYEVEVAAGDGDYLFGELEKEQVPYYYLNSLKRNLNIFNSFYFIYDLYLLIRKKDYDIIHLNSSNTLIGAISTKLLRKKPKTLFTFHGLSFIDRNFSSNAIIKSFARIYYKLLLKTIDKIVFECETNMNDLKNESMIKSAEVIYNGLEEKNMHFISKKEARKYFSTRTDYDLTNSFIIGSTGRLAYQKNYEFLIQNFYLIKERIPEAKVVIIGDGPDRDNYLKQIEKHGITKDFFLLGELRDSHQYMNGFDLFTLPSRYEGVSISLIEALYVPLAILATNVGGNSDIVGNDQRQLFNLDNIEEYLEKIFEIYKNRNSIIEHNSLLKERFSLKEMTKSYIKLYDELKRSY